jgi:hypothetical protein
MRADRPLDEAPNAAAVALLREHLH